jgi:predicted NodU family carbamoyl transferase
MKILGVSDGLDGGAALVVDDSLVACEAQSAFDGVPHSRAFPWDAVDDVLRRAEVRPGDIDVVAVAGRITPPFFLRRHPGARRLFRDPFSWALDLGVFYQAMMRQTGLAALQADRAADWLAERFETRGFRGRLVLVDIHTALANATYRSQDDDDLLIVTLHPLGDGVSFAVHRAALGQIDRVFEQKGFSTLQVHLARCAAVLGFDSVREMWANVGPAPDPEIVAALSSHLYLDDRKLSHARYPLPQDRRVYDLLGRVAPAVGAASVRANLSAAVTGLVRYHVRQHDIPRLAVAGDVFHERRLLDDLAALPEVQSVWCPADPGSGALAFGAAAYTAGLDLRVDRKGVADPDAPDREEPVSVERIAAVLREGGAVAWISGRGGLPAADGDRCTWRLEGPGHQLVPAPGTVLDAVVQRVGPVTLEPLGPDDVTVARRRDLLHAARGADLVVWDGRRVHVP